jgi:hypothetical protein
MNAYPDFPLSMALQNYMPVILSGIGLFADRPWVHADGLGALLEPADHQHDLECGFCLGSLDDGSR